MSDLYLPAGWLNFEYIASKPAWLYVVIGKRQVGKTYGALHHMLAEDKSFILLRRTTAELNMITSNPKFNPFKPFVPEFYVDLFKSGDVYSIKDYSLDDHGKAKEGKERGIATSLTQISKIRGFDGSAFTDIVFDEFIPEKGVITRKSEGDAILNALTTIGGNRELNGKPPLKVWLLANTNNISSAILDALDLTDIVLMMRRKGLEEYTTDDGCVIIQPQSEVITEKRKETALMKRISKKSEFYGMAIENEWSYDVSPYIKTLSLKGMHPVFSFDDNIYCWENDKGFYICKAAFHGKAPKFSNNQTDRETLARQFGSLIDAYYAGIVFFADLRCQSIFKSIFGID